MRWRPKASEIGAGKGKKGREPGAKYETEKRKQKRL